MSGAQRKLVRRSGAMAVAMAVATAVLVVPAEASAAGPGVCKDISRCRVVVRVDVNGDGVRDAVGVAKRGRNADPNGAVIVRVKTGPHRIVSARRKLEPWFGSPWHGAAYLDGQRGAELVVGHLAGAHTENFWALTWRRGKLVTLRAPGNDPDWVVDGAYSVSLGWQRRTTDRVETVRRLEAYRNSNTSTFSAAFTTYRWRAGTWQRVSRATNNRLDEDVASTWGGFRIAGLPRW